MKNYLSRKDRIIITTIDIINELGIQGLSTKEIASRQEIAESALYRHFKNKDEILVAVLEYYSHFDTVIFNSTQNEVLPHQEKIMSYIKLYIEYYENYPAITSIVQSYEIFRHETTTVEMIEKIFYNRLNNLKVLIEDGQDKEVISRLYTAEELSLMIIGFCNNAILEWRISNYGYSLKEKILGTINKLLFSIKINTA